MRTERSGSSRKNARACKGEGGAHSVQPRHGACLCMYGMRACVHQSEEYERPHDDSRELMLHQRNVVRSAHAHRCG